MLEGTIVSNVYSLPYLQLQLFDAADCMIRVRGTWPVKPCISYPNWFSLLEEFLEKKLVEEKLKEM